MFAWIYWDPSSEFLILPFLQIPITWYGILFAIGFWIGFHVFVYMMRISFKEKKKENLTAFAEKLLLYLIVGTVVGSRLGHILFYENPMQYFMNPLAILKTWEGGLASHGAVFAILLAVGLFVMRMNKEMPEFTFWVLLDYLAIPAMFVATMIRIGNFFNQEILGVSTDMPWGVVFGHPVDGGRGPRHPAQLYEAAFYFVLFGLLFALWRQTRGKLVPGRIAGITLTATFLFRFLIEFIKTEQSVWLSHPSLVMGQFLSLPVIAIGIYLLVRKEPFRKIID